MCLVVCEVSEVSLFFLFCWKILLFSLLGDPRLAFFRALGIKVCLKCNDQFPVPAPDGVQYHHGAFEPESLQVGIGTKIKAWHLSLDTAIRLKKVGFF